MPTLSTRDPHASPQAEPRYRELLCHYGELMLRGNNRKAFEDQAVRNLLKKLRQFTTATFRKLPGRFLIELADEIDWKTLAGEASKVFGLSNCYGIRRFPASVEAVCAALPELLAERQFATFAVRARRPDKKFPSTSHDIEVDIGRALQTWHPAQVDLAHPELTIWVEAFPDQCIVAIDRQPGARGLPIGMSGHVLALLSGGIDSPVAAWRMMFRGCRVSAVHFHSVPYTSPASREKVRELAATLAAWQGGLRLGMIPFGDLQQKIVLGAPQDLRVVLYRRLMLRIAAEIARDAEIQAHAIVTGDALGQVASQTLSNLSTIETASALPVLRPLIACDKDDIVALARRIGTYATSIEPHQDCCSYLEPRRPATTSRLDRVIHIESQLPMEEMIATGVASVEWDTVMA